MPKQVDHAERRREIIEALWRVTTRDGLAAVSFRDVAAEAGVSVRQIQYYFGTKAKLLYEAIQMLGDRIVARSLEHMAATGPEPTQRALLRAAITTSLPTDDESRTHTLLFFSFYVAAMTDPTLSSAESLGAPRWTVPFAAQLIRRAQREGQTRADIDPDREALVLMSAFSGLSLSTLAGLQTPDEATAAIDYYLDQLFRPKRRRRSPTGSK